MNDDLTKRKLLSALCHGSVFFSVSIVSVGIPIAILFIADDPVVQANAKEALNFHFNMWIYGAISWLLTFVLIGFVFLAILAIAMIVMPIIAMIQVLSNPSKPYRYPFIFHWL
jgi:uncharacterized Tic20 family protein